MECKCKLTSGAHYWKRVAVNIEIRIQIAMMVECYLDNNAK